MMKKNEKKEETKGNKRETHPHETKTSTSAKKSDKK